MNMKSIAYRALKYRLKLDSTMTSAQAARIARPLKEAVCNA